MQECICIIPARGGSKRILRKNLKSFCGKPILTYSIQNAQKSGIFNKIILTSDDEEILEVGKSYGITPLKRPEHLSDDYATTRDVILHAIDSTLDSTWVCCLYATAPLLEYSMLQKAFECAQQKAQDSYCFSAVEFDYTPLRGFCIKNGKNVMLFKEHFTKRSQDLEKIYHDAGQFYFAQAKTWKQKENIFEDSISFLLPASHVQDIDTLQDWKLAELKFQQLQNS